MARKAQFKSLTDLLDQVARKADRDGALTINSIRALAGRASFGPMILLPGLLAVTPLSGIPTVPTIIGTLVALVSIQLVIGRHKFWLPRKIEKAALNKERTAKAMRFMKPVARQIDKVVGPRFDFAARDWAQRGAGLCCFLVALTMPPLEILPFVASTAGAILSIFGLAITLRDGILMIIALLLFLGGIGALLWYFVL